MAAKTGDPSKTSAKHTGAENPTRLPHEHDESSDSQNEGVRSVIRQAHEDLAQGKQDTDRSKPTYEAYQRQRSQH